MYDDGLACVKVHLAHSVSQSCLPREGIRPLMKQEEGPPEAKYKAKYYQGGLDDRIT